MQKNIFGGDNMEFAAATLACIGDGIISTNMVGEIIYLNQKAEEILETNMEDAIGRDFYEVVFLYNLETMKPLDNLVAKALRNRTITGLENNTVIKTKSNKQKFVSATCTSVIDADGNAKGTVVVLRDISRLKKLEIEGANEKNNLKGIFDNAPLGMIMIDEERYITQVNQPALRFASNKEEWMIGKCFGDAFHCIDSELDEKGCGFGANCPQCKLRKATVRALVHGKASSNIEYQKKLTINEREGDYWLEVSVTPIRENGNRYAIITFLDITERKTKEILIERSRDYINNLINQIPSLLWITDENMRCYFVNKVWKDFTGTDMDEVSDYGWANVIHPKDLDTYVSVRATALRKLEPFQLEIRIKRYDNQYRWCLVVGAPYTDLEGMYKGYIGSIYDITDRIKAENRIRENQAKYRSLVMNMKCGYAYCQLVYDANNIPCDLKFIEVNETLENYLSVSKKYLVGSNVSTLFPKSYHIVMKDIIMYGYKLNRGESLYFPEFYSIEDNKWYSTSIYSPRKGDIVLITTDYTYLKKSELKLLAAKEAAEMANKAKSEFLANMSHEIRTPINGVVGMVDLTLLTKLNEEQKDNLITAKACANSLLNIINDILDFSKMEAGKLTVQKISFDAAELVKEIIKTHGPRAEEKGINLRYTLPSSMPQFLIGDPNRLRQVLNNLISNSLKFTEYGEITLEVKKMTQIHNKVELMFSIRDTGIGIASEDIVKLFQSFSQVEDVYTKKYGGTGLGLVISKRLVELMGGHIGVESEKGVGSTFYIQIAFEIGNYNNHEKAQPMHVQRAIKPLSILVAEDDIINQKVLRKMLGEKGHKVDIANNGIEVLSFFDKKVYDVILMDIQMPELDGIEATKKIREVEKEKGSHTPIIALTAYALKGDRERFLAIGMDEYLSKPVQLDVLYQTLEKSVLPDQVTLTIDGEIVFSKEKNISVDVQGIINTNNIADDVCELEKASKTDDLLHMEHLAHNIKVISNDLEMIELKDAAFKVELAARRGNAEECVGSIERLKEIFKTYRTLKYKGK